MVPVNRHDLGYLEKALKHLLSAEKLLSSAGIGKDNSLRDKIHGSFQSRHSGHGRSFLLCLSPGQPKLALPPLFLSQGVRSISILVKPRMARSADRNPLPR
jgi:hypothetical protein